MQARVLLEVSGGLAFFPGRASQPLSIICSDSRDIAQLRSFADEAEFCSRPEYGETDRPDARRYVLRIELDDRRRALAFADPVDVDLAPLLRFIRALAAEKRG